MATSDQNLDPSPLQPRQVWKFPLTITDQQSIDMPAYADIIAAEFQGLILCLWAIVVPNNPIEPRDIRIVGTGNPMPDARLRFIATAQMPVPGYPLVWHVFEAHENQVPAQQASEHGGEQQ